MVNFNEIYHFSRFQRGPTFSRGGGGGSNCLFPIETHITCDFPGGSGPPVPPLDPHLVWILIRSLILSDLVWVQNVKKAEYIMNRAKCYNFN